VIQRAQLNTTVVSSAPSSYLRGFKFKTHLTLHSIRQHNLFYSYAKLHVSTKSLSSSDPYNIFRYQMLCPIWDPKVGKASGNGKCCKGLKITNFLSKHVALLKNKKGCADIYCVTLIELQAHRDAFIQN